MNDWLWTYMTVAVLLFNGLVLLYLVAGRSPSGALNGTPAYQVAAVLAFYAAIWPLVLVWLCWTFVVETWKSKGKR